MIDRNDIHWYRDAIIYQVHVKSFFDSDNDGVGDFAGLTERLDYIRELGATAIWVMPFYPSPLRDDGYDIADYRGINPAFGQMRDFRRFIREAQARGLRVITELVINHTSDQHPWFQRARTAKPGSPWRDFYVWSDTEDRYKDARIIFCDVEKSNWTWDATAGAYYWHRFYSHQPDLNFENPRVLEAVIEIMEYWFEMGVDGLRLDAISYLVEAEGTSCDNLPGTHEVIRRIRSFIDARYPDRMLLAEANLWPEGIAKYFGDGDECQMAFHFPLMPRMYMAVASEERRPITDILRQTPDIPENCQWAIFLRNHDELTLEMVTQQERDYLWTIYAADARARLNLGIRRRLAPLLENDRRKIELLTSLLLSMPGTPVMYYGDEIGMGDNIYLGDRDGVRTPMQWSPDRNGGFSRADPARLVLPAVQDPVYGFDAVNVESQRRNPSSLLNWMKRMVAARRNTRAFGRGSMRFIYPDNRKILAYLRAFDDETILCVANLSRAPQAAEIELPEFAGWRLVEMSGGAEFPPVSDLPYQITLPAYGFYWFRMEEAAVVDDRFGPRPVPELFTLVLTGAPQGLFEGREGEALARESLPRYLGTRRWFTGSRRRINTAEVRDVAMLPGAGDGNLMLSLVDVTLRSGEQQEFFIPLAVDESGENEALLPYAIARLRRGARMGLLYGAEAAPAFVVGMVRAMRDNAHSPTLHAGAIEFRSGAGLEDAPELDPHDLSRMRLDQSNTSMALGSRMVLKLYRRLQQGVHPEEEMCRYLTEVAGFTHTPRYLGSARHVAADGAITTLALLQDYVRNQGDAWDVATSVMQREIEHLAQLPVEDRPSPEQAFESFGHYAHTIGRRVGEMHAALARQTSDQDFSPVAMSGADVDAIAREAHEQAAKTFAGLRQLLEQAGPARASAADNALLVSNLLEREGACLELIIALSSAAPQGICTRIHGDLHLGQFLIERADVFIVDFEGRADRPVAERRRKTTPMRDVASMLRSVSYVTETVLHNVSQRIAHVDAELVAAARRWRDLSAASFRESYDAAIRDTPLWIHDLTARERLLRLCLLAKALHEINHELERRPDFLHIPIKGAIDLIDQGDGGLA